MKKEWDTNAWGEIAVSPSGEILFLEYVGEYTPF
jgi:hypothetical protein